MKTNYKVVLVLSLNLLLLCSLISPSHGQAAFITLSPNTGISAITLEGSDFTAHSTITISWDDEPIPTLPLHVSTDETGAFTCIISAYHQTSEGAHEVKAMDEDGNTALATFTVVNVRGPSGEPGLPGESAEGISPGYFAGWLFLAAATGGLLGVLLGRRQRRESESETTATVESW